MIKLSTSDIPAARADSHRRILLVYGDPFNTLALKLMFQQYGLAVDAATDGVLGLEAVKKLHQEQQRSYELIVLDANLPQLNGLEAIVQIKEFLASTESAGNLKTPYFCCLVNLSDPRSSEDAIGAGFDTTLAKPVFKRGIQNLLLKSSLLDNARSIN